MRVFKSLREANLARVMAFNHTLEGWTLAQWACALAGEVGEYCNIVKKMFRGKPGDEAATLEKAGEELADIQIYLDLNAARLGLDLQEITQKKFNAKSEEIGSDIRLHLVNEEVHCCLCFCSICKVRWFVVYGDVPAKVICQKCCGLNDIIKTMNINA